MHKRLFLIFLTILALAGIAYGQTLQPYSFPFVGRWNASENPLLLDDYGLQDIQNLRKDGKHFKGVSGHTAINTVYVSGASNDYPYILNGFHFRKDQPAESHVIVYAADSMTPTHGRLYQNTTAVPNAGDFSATVLHTPAAFNDIWRFSLAPAGNMVASNGNETLIWGGNEIEATSFVTSSAAVTYTLTNSNDYSDILSNTRQTSDQVATLSVNGGNDSYTKLLLHFSGTDGSSTITDSSSSVHAVTSTGPVLDTDQTKFGTASLLTTGAAGHYLWAADSADWDVGNGDFCIDFWIRRNATGSLMGLCGQGAAGGTDGDFSTYMTINAGNQLSGVLVSGSTYYTVTHPTTITDTTTWHHVAFIRSGSYIAVAVDGVLSSWGNVGAAAANNSTTVYVVGQVGLWAGWNRFNGWFDEFRFTKDVPRWINNFTPPNQAYGNGSNYFLIGTKRPLQGVKFYVSSGNTVSSTMTVREWQGQSWTTLSVTDNTDTGPTLAQTGTITWTATGNAKARYINGLSLYWYQFSFDAGQASIYYITVDASIQSIKNIWDGAETDAIKCLKYDGTIYKDYTDDVGDDLDSSYADVSSLQTTHALYVGFLSPQQGLDIKMVVGSENSTSGTAMSIYFWNGSSWEGVTALNDATDTSTTSLSKSGVISWQAASLGTEFKRAISDEFPLYYYKIQFTAALDADTKIAEIKGIPFPQALPTFKFSATFQNRLFLFNDKGGNKNAGFYSASNAPDIFNGDDSGTLIFGGKTELTAATTIYNVFMNATVDQMIVTKANETYRLSGSDPTTWVLQRMSANIGCVAPLTMVSCEVIDATSDVKRTVAIWQGSAGIYMSDGATIVPISDDIKCYWDPNDSRYIPASMQGKSVAWYDPVLQSYKLLIASGSTAAYLNTELEYSLKYKEWTKVYRENASGANPLQCGFQVHDTNGLGYTYGGGKDGFLYRLEHGNNWNGMANISQYIQTKDLILDNQAPLFRLSTIKYIRTAYKQKVCATGPLSITHYGDRTQTVTGVKGQYAPFAVTAVPSTLYNTQSCNLGPFLYHSFKFSQTTDCADGMELTGFGVYFDPLTTIR